MVFRHAPIVGKGSGNNNNNNNMIEIKRVGAMAAFIQTVCYCFQKFFGAKSMVLFSHN